MLRANLDDASGFGALLVDGVDAVRAAVEDERHASARLDKSARILNRVDEVRGELAGGLKDVDGGPA